MIRRGQNDLGIESEQVSFDVELIWKSKFELIYF